VARRLWPRSRILVRRTWAPRGQTPLQRAWERHDRLSVIGGISVSPKRQHLRLAFQVHSENIRTPHVVDFIRQMQEELRRPLIVVMDRLPAHRSAARELLATHGDRLGIEWLPAYAPELNPMEYQWGHAKYSELANFVPHDTPELRRAVFRALGKKRERSQLLRSFFHAAKLKL
jgi:transposase